MSVLDQLNLRPQERRILVVVGFLIFVVLNWMFVRPLFGQWADANEELAKIQKTQATYETEIAKVPTYKTLEDNLRKGGYEVLSEELQLQRVVVEQYAAAAGIIPSRVNSSARPTGGKTNQFFEDQTLTVDFTAFSTNFIEWLVGLATGNNMIRVQELNLKPDPSGQRLNGSILFVASYQKKTPARGPAGPAVAARPLATDSTTTATNRAAGVKAPPPTFPATNLAGVKSASTTKPSTNAPKPADK